MSLTIYNTAGQMVRELFADHQPPEFYDVTWNGRNQEGKPVASAQTTVRSEYTLVESGEAEEHAVVGP